MTKECILSAGNLPRLPRNRVYRITDGPDMTSVVDLGRKALTTNKQMKKHKRQLFSCGKSCWPEPKRICVLCHTWFINYGNLFTTYFEADIPFKI